MSTSPDVMSQLTSLTPKIPEYTPPDTSALDTEITQGKAKAQQAETQLETAETEKADLPAQFAQGQQRYEQQIDQMLKQYPSQQVAYGAAMHTAPIVAMLASLGGKASGLSGTAMLGALNGMMTGFNQGAEDQYKENLEKWKTTLSEMKDRHAEQFQIYKLMLDAYSGRADAAQKARDFALTATHDAMDQKEARVKDSIDLFKARAQAISQADKATLLLDKLLTTGPTAGYTPQAQELDAALARRGISLPGGARSGPAYFARLNAIRQQNPGMSADQVVDGIYAGQIDTKIGMTEATVAARKEAGVEGAMLTLNAGPPTKENPKGGLYWQLDQAAKDVDFSDAKIGNRIKLASQGKVIDDAKVQYYVTKVQEARAELAQVFTKSGVMTDTARHAAEEALPISASYSSLQQAIRSSQEAAEAVRNGNKAFMDAIKGGKSVSEALKDTGDTPNRKTIGGVTYEKRDGKWYQVANG